MLEILKNSIFSGPCNPTKKLPMAKRVKDTQVILVGYPGKLGCFSAKYVGSGEIDIALYTDHTPAEINAILLSGKSIDCEYLTLEEAPGWGYKAIHELKRRLP